MRHYVNILLTVADISHFYFIWEISKHLNRRDLNPIAFFLLTTFTNTHEHDLAEHLWIIYIQKDVFTDKQYGKLKHDFEFTVIDGVVRCKERLGNSSLSFNTKHSIFLPKCCFTKLVTIYHQVVLRNGVKGALNERRTKCCSTCKNYDVHSLVSIPSTKHIYQIRECPVNHLLHQHLLIIQDPWTYKIYTKEVTHTKLGLCYLYVLPLAVVCLELASSCVCVCVCVFSSTVKASPDWNKTINVMPEIKSAMLCWRNYSVSGKTS